MAINNSDIGTAANMFAHGTVTGNNHMGIFTPNTGSIKAVEKNTRLGTIIIEELTSRSGRLVKMPIITKFNVAPINFAGRLREIWMFRDAIIGNNVTNGATINGYIIGNNTATIADCVLFSTGST
jgi:hypothetical protein